MRTQLPITPVKQAFSLVELSIVLVILGLLVGGVLAGQSLIRAAELRSVSTEYSRWVTATQTFRDKYFALPGDMPNATAFWGAANPSPATCRSTQSIGQPTCNGDGNGALNFSSVVQEYYRFWQHLANANLIEGQYYGSNTSAAGILTPDTNIAPSSKWPRNIWTAFNYNGSPPRNDLFNIEYGNMLALSIPVSIPADNVIGGIGGVQNMNAADAWNVDLKIDDGMPARGSVVSKFSSCTTALNANDLNSTYAYRALPLGDYCFLLFPRFM